MKSLLSPISRVLRMLLLCAVLISPWIIVQASYAEKSQTLRFYTKNKKSELNKLFINRKKLAEPGCHNFGGTKKIYRLTQIGYKFCRLYADKDCVSGTEIEGLWKGKMAEKNTDFSQGGKWMFTINNELGEKAKSWQCG
jgi:hypothetical protein